MYHEDTDTCSSSIKGLVVEVPMVVGIGHTFLTSFMSGSNRKSSSDVELQARMWPFTDPPTEETLLDCGTE